MSLPTLTIFSNCRINDEERFLRMKDSLSSFKDIAAEKWVINVRGKYQKETIAHLKGQLNEKLSFHTIESGKGWFHDSRTLLDEIQTDFVLYWIEDHISMVPAEKYTDILKEMKESKSEFLFTSWFLMDQMENAYEGINKDHYDHIDTMTIDMAAAKKIDQKFRPHFIISALGLFDSRLFKRVVLTNHPTLRRWPKETPFDLEKRVTDYHWIPIRVSLPKYELFAPIDDDLRGYKGSLQSRGLYPLRELRVSPVQRTSTYLLPVKKVYDALPGPVKLPLNYLIVKPYYKIRYFLLRLSYHF